MISSVNTLSTSAITTLFGNSKANNADSETALSTAGVKGITGHTDDVFKAGDAIGNIIAIAARMKGSDKSTQTVFSMDGATQKDNADGSYTLVKTGKGLGDASPIDPDGLISAERNASGTSPGADEANTNRQRI